MTDIVQVHEQSECMHEHPELGRRGRGRAAGLGRLEDGSNLRGNASGCPHSSQVHRSHRLRQRARECVCMRMGYAIRMLIGRSSAMPRCAASTGRQAETCSKFS